MMALMGICSRENHVKAGFYLAFRKKYSALKAYESHIIGSPKNNMYVLDILRLARVFGREMSRFRNLS